MTVALKEKSPPFEKVVRNHQADLWRFLLALGCKPAEAEDIVQEVFVEAFRCGFEYRGERAAVSYFRKAAKHRFISTARKRRRAPLVTNLDDVEHEWAQFDAAHPADVRIALLKECMTVLNERSRRALGLRYRDDASREEIAGALEMKPAGVKTLLERARHKLRECVERKRGAHE